MPIYLEPFERSYLLHVLNKEAYSEEKPAFVAKQLIIGKVKSDNLRLEEIGNCQHEYSEHTGKKVCCVKCGAFPEGEGFEWERKNE